MVKCHYTRQVWKISKAGLNNPKRSNDMFNYNPRFIFFQEFPTSKDPSEGPKEHLESH